MGKYNFDIIVNRKGTEAQKEVGFLYKGVHRDLINLWIADMDFEVCDEIVNDLKNRLDHKVYGYSNPSDRYWNSILNWLDKIHDFKVDREELTYIPGVMKGFSMAIDFFTEPGDAVVIQQPVYHPFKNVTVGNGRTIVVNHLKEVNGTYEMDFDDLEKILIEKQPKVFVLCNPHNPVGIVWPVETLQKLATLCRKHNTLVISDEIHADLAIFGHKHHPFASVSEDAAQNSITLGAPSKTFNIAGIVSAWCVIKNPELRKDFFEWLEVNEYNSTCFISSIATQSAYENGKQWLDEAKEYIEGNIIAIEEYCKANLPNITPTRPEASFLVWLDCRKLNLNHDELNDLFVEKAGLALNDGEMFGAGGEGFMRLNVAVARPVLMKAMEQLKTAIEA